VTYAEADTLLQGRCRRSRKLARNTYVIHPVEPRCDTVAKALDWVFQTEGYLDRLAAEA
jgi:hypothetical protein